MDQYISYYWKKKHQVVEKIFFFGIEMCINNSYILYKQNTENNKKIDFLNYRLHLITQILQKYSQKSNICMENIKIIIIIM